MRTAVNIPAQFTPAKGRHDTQPRFRDREQVPVADNTGRVIAPPYLTRALHEESGSTVLRRATREEIRNHSRFITVQPIWMQFAGRWYSLTPRGVWAATTIPCRFKLLTNSNGDSIGYGIY